MKLAKCLFHFITNANRNTGKQYTHQHTMILTLEIQRVQQASPWGPIEGFQNMLYSLIKKLTG